MAALFATILPVASYQLCKSSKVYPIASPSHVLHRLPALKVCWCVSLFKNLPSKFDRWAHAFLQIFNDPDDPCDTFIKVTSSQATLVLSFTLLVENEGPLPLIDVSGRDSLVLNTSVVSFTNLDSYWWVPIAKVLIASYDQDLLPSVVSITEGFTKSISMSALAFSLSPMLPLP